MDAQDFRSLQEAYMEVVMNEGEQPYPSEKVNGGLVQKVLLNANKKVMVLSGNEVCFINN